MLLPAAGLKEELSAINYTICTQLQPAGVQIHQKSFIVHLVGFSAQSASIVAVQSCGSISRRG